MKYISMQVLLLAPLTMTTSAVHAHMLMSGPLPKEFREHRDDISWLKLHVNTDDSSKQFYGLHFYYAMDLEARKLTLKLLNSEDAEAQIAALNIIGHCGGHARIAKVGEHLPVEAADKDILHAVNARLAILSSSSNAEVRKSAIGVSRSLRKRARALKKTVRP